MFTTNIINYFFFFDKAGCTRCFFRKPTSPPLTLSFFLKSTRPSLPLKKAPPLISVFSPQGKRGNRPTRCSNRFAIWMADHQRSTPAAELRIFVRDEPQGHVSATDATAGTWGLLLIGTQGHNAGGLWNHLADTPTVLHQD